MRELRRRRAFYSGMSGTAVFVFGAVVFECGKPGHAARECPNTTSCGSGKGSPQARGNNRQPIKSLMDLISNVNDKDGDVDVHGFKRVEKGGSGRPTAMHLDALFHENRFEPLVQTSSLDIGEPETTYPHQAPPSSNSSDSALSITRRSVGGARGSGARGAGT